MPEPPPRPLTQLPLGGGAPAPTPGSASRHETILPGEPQEVVRDLADALEGGPDPAALRERLEEVAARHPAALEPWARLSELALHRGDAVVAYALSRVAYHRGLDRLRREGWGGTGMVRWARPTNRGFLRGLHALLAASAALDERDEAERCRAFLLDLDPDDSLGVAAYPRVPGPDWTAPQLPG